MRKVIIIGSGPAGYTAALYTARAQLEPVVYIGEPRAGGSILPGGQLMLTTEVENYPGFEHGIDGPKLMKTMRAQAERFGAKMVEGWVEEVAFGEKSHRLRIDDQWDEARALIVCTGAAPKLLPLPEVKPADEGGLMSRGISTCATCDGAFFKGKDLAIVGGGDSAMEEATFLTRYATTVTVVHRRQELRASKIMQERARKNPKIRWALNADVKRVEGKEAGRVTGVVLADTQSGAERRLPVQGLFIAIGHDPNTQVFRGKLDLDPAGYIRLHEHTQTNVRGVFAAGDCVDHRYRQAVTAAGMGCQAAIDAERYLETLGL